MKDLIEYIIKSLVSQKDKVEIIEEEDDFIQLFKVKAADEDKGVLIGRAGRNIKAIRQIASILSRKNNKRVNIIIED